MSVSPDNTIDFYIQAEAVWDAMYADCEKATSSISMEQYILMDNEIGIKFMKLFIEKQKQGVHICLVLDRIGCRRMLAHPLALELQKSGGDIHGYNPLNLSHLFFPKTWFPRNHSKLLMIDRKIVYIGSSCIDQTMHDWRETQMRIEGPFGESVDIDLSRLAKRLKKGKMVCAPIQETSREKIKEACPDSPFIYATSRSHLKTNPIYKTLLDKINGAQSHITLATPYFFPPRRLRKAMRRAIKRGVRIDLIMSRRSDKFWADCVGHSYIPKMLRMGLNVYLYEPSIFHAKYVVVDDWAMLGSTNLDYLSLMFNRESNVMIQDQETIDTLKEHAKQDISDSMAVTKEFWKNEPIAYKIIGYTGRLFRKVL